MTLGFSHLKSQIVSIIKCTENVKMRLCLKRKELMENKTNLKVPLQAWIYISLLWFVHGNPLFHWKYGNG